MKHTPEKFLSEDYWKNDLREYKSEFMKRGHNLSSTEYIGYQTKFLIAQSGLSKEQQAVVMEVIVNAIQKEDDESMRRSKEQLEKEWKLIEIDNVGSRLVYFFDSVLFGEQQRIRISVSRTFANPEEQAWKQLDEIVK